MESGTIVYWYSPTSRNVKAVWDDVSEKIALLHSRAANIVVDLTHSSLSAVKVAEYFLRNSVVELLVLIEGEKVIVIAEKKVASK